MKDPESCENIVEIRESIDEIDHQIMKLFGQRNEYVKRIVQFKSDEVAVVAVERQMEVIKVRREWALQLGLDPDLFETIYWALINYNVDHELAILRKSRNNQI